MSAAIQSAETMAFLRTLVAGDKRLAAGCEDYLAKLFLGYQRRLLAAVSSRSVIRRVTEMVAPGSYGFTIARTRYFDDALVQEARGIQQLVLLGAGYDSRPFRFRDLLGGVCMFEIDHPATQSRKQRMLSRAGKASPRNLRYVPVDFNKTSLRQALAEHEFMSQRRTLFLWEGVSYYLPQPVVEDVLDVVAGCAAGSSIVFDYATRRFVNGDISTYGSREVARWLKRIGEPFLFGLDPGEAEGFLRRRGLHLVSDLGAGELEELYLKTKDGRRLGRTLGHVRMAQARMIVVPAIADRLLGEAELSPAQTHPAQV
jgi:methyltransferase (TIGR00027 family)